MEAEKLTCGQVLDRLYERLTETGEMVYGWEEDAGEMFYLGDTQGIIASSYFIGRGQLNRLSPRRGFVVVRGRPTVLSAVGFEEGVLYEKVELKAEESWQFYRDNLSGVVTLRSGIVASHSQLFVWSPSLLGRLPVPGELVLGSRAESAAYSRSVVDFVARIARRELSID